MTAHTVALITPEGDIQAWLGSGPGREAIVTTAAWLAEVWPTRADAVAAAKVQNRIDKPIRDHLQWVAAVRTAVTPCA